MTASVLAPTAVPTATALTEPVGRPLGLSYARQVPPAERPVLDGLVYDEDRQITVCRDGTALADNPLVAETWGTTDTRYDSQYEPDQVKVD